MAATTPDPPPQLIESFFSNLDEQNSLLTKYTDLYKTLIDNFTNLQKSLDEKSQTLDSNLQTLDSNLTQTLDSLQKREDSLPELLDSLSTAVESRKNVAISEATKPIPDESESISEKLSWVCGRMDPTLLVKFLLVKRREASTLRLKMSAALSECVDAERFVVDAVRDFVQMKREKRVGMTDFRWACSMAVGSMFPPENLKEGKVGMAGLSRVFSKKAVERAEAVLREWKEVADNEAAEGEGSGGCGMWHSEAAMFIEVVLGFGLVEMFDREFYKKLIVEFCGRRVMAKLAVPIFGDEIADLIEELVKDGKEIETIYFAFESGLTEKFQPVSLLKTALRKSKKNCVNILKKGHNSSAATDEANNTEMISIKAIIKCVEDHKIEEQFPIESLRKRLAVLEKDKADKKGATVRYSKRTGGARPSGTPHSRPAKRSSPYPTFARRDHAPQSRLNPASMYPSPYTYPSQTTYDTGLAPSTYPPSYGGSHIPTSTPAPPTHVDQYYGVPGGGTGNAGNTSSYGSEVGYASYDYGATVAPAYHPPAYP
ncbi:hypothetical protein KSS87_011429 [Heliosperma pusillum]|nr:hypothetical protein KSS87_011429 [Heliosperma pusillum]